MSDMTVLEEIRGVESTQEQSYAIKERHAFREVAVKRLENEYDCLQRVESQYTPRASNFRKENGQAHMRTTVVNGERFDVILPNLSEAEFFKILRQIAEGVQHCHGKQVLVNELKLENILVPGNQPAQIMDFSKAQVLTRHYSYYGEDFYKAVDKRFAAEEQLLLDSSKESDCWHLGVIAYMGITSRVKGIEPSAVSPINEEIRVSEGTDGLSFWQINPQPIEEILTELPTEAMRLTRLLSNTLYKATHGMRPTIQDHIDTYAHFESFYKNSGKPFFKSQS